MCGVSNITDQLTTHLVTYYLHQGDYSFGTVCLFFCLYFCLFVC